MLHDLSQKGFSVPDPFDWARDRSTRSQQPMGSAEGDDLAVADGRNIESRRRRGATVEG